jgi:hypothetical protein
MQRPKWLIGWGEGKNLLEARLLIAIPDIMVVEASFNKNLLFFAIRAKKNETASWSTQSDKGSEIESRTDLKWRIFYDSTALPQSMAIDKAKNLMAGIVSATTGSASVYNLSTAYIASSNKPSKGNAPHLLDYEMAKKIEEAIKKIS